jgi:Ran GTPase-activating protein (RanGAP) involved in mRNA processing and transport
MMKIITIKSITCCLFLVVFIQSFSYANGEPDPQLVKHYVEMMKGKTKLDLGYDEISDAETQALAEALKNNRSLTSLYIANAKKIGAAGAQALADALKVNKTLIYLLLFYAKNIGTAGVQALAEALKINNTLKMLWLSDNNIDDDGAKILAEALKINKVLTKLDLDNNQIGAEGAKAVEEIDRQLNINAQLTKIISVHLDLFKGFTDSKSVISTLPKELILKILSTYLELENLPKK